MTDQKPFLWSGPDTRELISWAKTFHAPYKPEVEWNVWQLAIALENTLDRLNHLQPQPEIYHVE